MYILCETRIYRETGAIAVNTAHGPYPEFRQAREAMEELYRNCLEEYRLDDNDTCDEDDEAIPGGHISDTEAGIYDYMDFAMGQLLEFVSLTIVNLRGNQH